MTNINYRGGKMIGGEWVVPGNVIMRQRGKNLENPQNADFKRDLNTAFARAVIREGLQNNTALDFHDGDVVAAAKTLDIDLIAEVKAVREEKMNAQVNDAMNAADQTDADKPYIDLEDLIARFPAM